MLPSQPLPRWVSIGVAFPLIFLNGWLFLLICQSLQPIPNILLTASLVAFLLGYPIGFLEKQGLPRLWAIALVTLTATLILAVVGLVLGPIIFQQLIDFVNRLPVWFDAAQKQLQTLDEQTILQQLPIDLSGFTSQLTSQLSSALKSLTSRIIYLTLNTIDSLVNLVATTVLTILLVLNGNSLWNGLMSWLPEIQKNRIQSALQQSFQGYFAGQAIIASIFSLALAIAFFLLNIPFGLLFAFGIGIASVIPFGGITTILFVSGLLTFQSGWLGAKVLITAILLAQLNDNVVAPRLLGGITGLNPALIVVSLLIGVKVAGFLGLILAVPTASFIKRITDFWRGSLLLTSNSIEEAEA